MNRFLYVVLILLMPSLIFAQKEKVVKSKITKVTVYKIGAAVTRSVKTNLKNGSYILTINNLPKDIKKDNIQVSASNGITILSVTSELSYFSKDILNSSTNKLSAKRVEVNDSIKLLNNLVEVLNKEKKLLLTNKVVGGKSGLTTEEFKIAANYYRKQLADIRKEKDKLAKRIITLIDRLSVFDKQLKELNHKGEEVTSRVDVTVSVKQDTKARLDVTYMVNDASWSPEYDIRTDNSQSLLKLMYKAKVKQSSGEDWSNVKMTLSTGNPQKDKYLPALKPYIISKSYNRIKVRGMGSINSSDNGVRVFSQISGRVTSSEDGLGIPGVNVVIKGTNLGVATDVDGKYTINVPEGADKLVFSAMGYRSHEVWLNSRVINIVLNPENISLDEVVVVAYGVKSKSLFKSNKPKKREKPVYNIPMEINKGQTSVEFSIDTPYSIPSDDKPYDVQMIEYPVDVTYTYSAVPKLSSDTYLMAGITNYSKYNLSDGLAKLYLNGTYMGDTHLDMGTTSDTMKISVGRDPDIIVKRKSIKKYTEKSFTSSYKKVKRAWEITVKNNKSYAVDLHLYDQYPVSTDSDIKVKLEEHLGATIDEDSGELKWKLHLEPKQTKKVIIKYTVKYSRDKNLYID